MIVTHDYAQRTYIYTIKPIQSQFILSSYMGRGLAVVLLTLRNGSKDSILVLLMGYESSLFVKRYI